MKAEMPKMKPNLYLSDKDLKEIKGWIPGKEYDLKVRVKEISMSLDEDDVTRANFEILKVENIGKDEKTEELKNKFNDHYRK